jgi:hypothetical protein
MLVIQHWKLKKEAQKFKGILGYIVKLGLIKTKPTKRLFKINKTNRHLNIKTDKYLKVFYS